LRQAITEQKLAILTLMQRNVIQLEDVRAVTIVEPPEVEAQETQTVESEPQIAYTQKTIAELTNSERDEFERMNIAPSNVDQILATPYGLIVNTGGKEEARNGFDVSVAEETTDPETHVPERTIAAAPAIQEVDSREKELNELIDQLRPLNRHWKIEWAREKKVPMKALLHASALWLSDDPDDRKAGGASDLLNEKRK